MKAARIHRFGTPDEVVVEEAPRPAPAAGELLIRVAASGVGPWDALIREGKSKVSPPPPCRISSRFTSSSPARTLTPVRLPPGLAMLAARPVLTMSAATPMIGIVLV